MSAYGVKRTWPIAAQMSAYDPKRTSALSGRLSIPYDQQKRPTVRAGNFARLSPRDSLALKGGKQFGIVSVDILAEIRDAIIGPSCQVCDVNG